MKIFVAIDTTPESADVAKTAVSMFGDGHHYDMVSIAEYATPDSAGAVGTAREILRLRDDMAGDAIDLATRTAEEAASDMLPDDVEVVAGLGSAGPSICRLAGDLGSDVIVLGSHDRSIWARIFHMSIGKYVVEHAPCSVLVVK